jgi:type IV pilus assembly protein PilW
MMLMPDRQRGLTLVELLVAVALSVLVALAAVSALVVSRRGFSTVDAASELRDNARFSAGLLQRLTAQAGFLDSEYAGKRRDLANLGPMMPNVTVPTFIQGFNNALVSDATNPLGTSTNSSRTAACNSAAGGGCSDILVVRYQAQALARALGAASSPSDLSVIDCRGQPIHVAPRSRDERGVSVFYVAEQRGELALMCLSGLETVNSDGTSTVVQYDDPPTAGWYPPVAIAQGVEGFQVLYGTDGLIAGALGSGPTLAPTDSVPDSYLRADQMVDPTSPANTNRNWRRVRSVRIGMVLRGPTGSLQESAYTDKLYPFGRAGTASGPGTALSSADDAGTAYVPPNDRRLRQTVTFTIYLHNDQGLCVGPPCAPE